MADDLTLATAPCRKCGDEKPLSEFYASKSHWPSKTCKDCSRRYARDRRAQLISELGVDVVRERGREAVAKVRSTPEGREKARSYNAARRRALQRLSELHSREFRHLLDIELRNEEARRG